MNTQFTGNILARIINAENIKNYNSKNIIEYLIFKDLNRLKLHQTANFFKNRKATKWNILPDRTISAKSLKSFKATQLLAGDQYQMPFHRIVPPQHNHQTDPTVQQPTMTKQPRPSLVAVYFFKTDLILFSKFQFFS